MSAFRTFVQELDAFEPSLNSLESIDASSFTSSRFDDLQALEEKLTKLEELLAGFCARAAAPKERKVYGPKMIKNIGELKTRFDLLSVEAAKRLGALKAQWRELEQKQSATKLQQEQEVANRTSQRDLDEVEANARDAVAKEREAELQRQAKLHASAEKKRQDRAEQRRLLVEEKEAKESKVRAMVAAKLQAEDERRRREAEAEKDRAHQRSIFAAAPAGPPAPAFGSYGRSPAPVSPSAVSFSALLNSSFPPGSPLSPSSPLSPPPPTEVDAVLSDEEFDLITSTADPDTIIVTIHSSSIASAASSATSSATFARSFDTISVEHADAEVICLSVDSDALKGLSAAQAVTRFPTVTFHVNNKRVSSVVGTDEAQLRAEIARLITEREERLVAQALQMSVLEDEEG
jgi:hypothetical protein